jgi:hypothetical protein
MQQSESNTRIDGGDGNVDRTGNGLTHAGQGRRIFIGAAAAALFAGVAIQITGCSTDDKDDAENPSASGDKSGVVLGNHPAPHKAVITKAQFDAGGGVTLDIQGSSDHTHSVVFTADQVATIKAGQHAMTSSTTFTPSGGAGHAHEVMFN